MTLFEEKIKKPMELYLHTLHDCNVTSMSSLNTFDANDMQSHKLRDAIFYEDDLFSPPSFDKQICFDDTLPPIYDDSTILEEATIDFDKFAVYDDYFDDTYAIKFAPVIVYEKDFAYMESNKFSMHVHHDNNALCDSYIVEFIHDATENYY